MQPWDTYPASISERGPHRHVATTLRLPFGLWHHCSTHPGPQAPPMIGPIVNHCPDHTRKIAGPETSARSAGSEGCKRNLLRDMAAMFPMTQRGLQQLYCLLEQPWVPIPQNLFVEAAHGPSVLNLFLKTPLPFPSAHSSGYRIARSSIIGVGGTDILSTASGGFPTSLLHVDAPFPDDCRLS